MDGGGRYNTVYTVLTGAFALRPAALVWRDVRETWWPSMRVSLQFWPPVHLVTFSSLVPLEVCYAPRGLHWRRRGIPRTVAWFGLVSPFLVSLCPPSGTRPPRSGRPTRFSSSPAQVCDNTVTRRAAGETKMAQPPPPSLMYTSNKKQLKLLWVDVMEIVWIAILSKARAVWFWFGLGFGLGFARPPRERRRRARRRAAGVETDCVLCDACSSLKVNADGRGDATPPPPSDAEGGRVGSPPSDAPALAAAAAARSAGPAVGGR
jgi:hypothetical protein